MKKPVVVCIDDEPMVLESLKIELKKALANDCLIETAEGGQDALALFAELQADDYEIALVLSDHIMPDIRGDELLKKIHHISPQTLKIMLTGQADLEAVSNAIRYAKLYRYIAKPWEPDDLRLTVVEALHSYLQKKKLAEKNRMLQEVNQKLETLNADLEHLVQERTAKFAAANASLKASNAELDAFARTVAHDLKNPLGIMIGYADYLREDFSNIDPQETIEVLNIVRQTGQKMTNIIDELLLLAQVRKEEVKTSELDMVTIIAQAQERLTFMIFDYQGEIIVPPAWPKVVGYAPWIEEVWVNYLSNGLKYGGQSPRLELGATPEKNGSVRFWVRDEGPGISLEAQPILFSEFTRPDVTQAEGYGLGLSIVRRIVEKLGGTVGVESEPGQGSLFYFTLPQTGAAFT